MSYNSYDITEAIKKYTLICLIKNINKIDDNYLVIEISSMNVIEQKILEEVTNIEENMKNYEGEL